MMKLMFSLFAAFLYAVPLFAQGYTVEEKELCFETRVRVHSFARESQNITNVMNWPQVLWLIPDGSAVKKGDLLMEFDAKPFLENMENLGYDKETIGHELQKELVGIDDRQKQLTDQLAGLKADMAILEAKYARLKAMPFDEDVKMAEGDHEIALQKALAAEKELAKAKGRLEREMISRIEFRAKETQYLLARTSEELALNALNYTRLPVSSSTLRITELEIENARMEIEKLENEIEKQKGIAEIQKEGALSQSRKIAKRIADLQEELDGAKLYAPVDGVVSYTVDLKRTIVEGGKLRKQGVVMEIPELSSLAFDGALPERERSHFSGGDTVKIRLNQDPEHPLKGQVESIKNLPRDIVDREEIQWADQGKESGIKVFDLTLKTDEVVKTLRPGMYGSALITSASPFTAPAIPLEYVRFADESYYISIDGVYQKVEGEPCSGFFALKDPSWLGRTIQKEGQFAQEGDAFEVQTDRMVVSGELTPTEAVDVRAPRMRGWYSLKVDWVIEDDTVVKEGDEITRIVSENLDDHIERLETDIKKLESDKKALEEQMALKETESDFILKKEENLLEIARLNKKIADEGADTLRILKARAGLRRAEIELADMKRLVEWTRERRNSFAPFEVERRERDLKRRELQLEAAQIHLETAEQGTSELQKSQANLSYIRRKVTFEALSFRLETDKFKLKKKVTWARRRYDQKAFDLNKSLEDREELVIKAPVAGLVKLQKVWGSLGMIKVKKGVGVWHRQCIMTISSVSKMYVKVPVSERYYSDVSPGMQVDLQIPSVAKERFRGTVSQIEFLFEPQKRPDTERGLYADHENLSDHIFNVQVVVEESEGLFLKPGTIAHVIFPFEQ